MGHSKLTTPRDSQVINAVGYETEVTEHEIDEEDERQRLKKRYITFAMRAPLTRIPAPGWKLMTTPDSILSEPVFSI